MWTSDLHDVSLTYRFKRCSRNLGDLENRLSAMAGATRNRSSGGHFLLTDGGAKKDKASMRHIVGKT